MRNKHDSPGSRRRFLGGVLGGSLGAGLIGLAGDAAAQSAPAACLLTPALTEGPFYIDQALMRSDIRDGRPGQLLRLRLVVMDTDRGCAPVAGALASIWHCDAGGSYSGYDQAGMPPPPGARGGRIPPSAGGAGPGREEGGMHAAPTSAARFLRGVQPTRADGSAQFLTIYPGWYAPRAVHIHLKIHVGKEEVLTSQMFFDEALNREVLLGHPAYRARGASPYRNSQDPIAGAHPGLVRVRRLQDAAGTLEGEFTIGIART
ncbi:protocatechuate 3,4-dioxygenase [Cupriavidus basilensis]|uniref:protocatechuate 3,4-dioxygenase n=1 Tax=Cupriavidus basilensis TaxID=68895 RepID=UPI0023E7F97A|nr:protocatechuate 3,4-dioxygenase [Cupriavidus basilensis]MDF3888483.1 protocatechuate 3,4-dioxygenase [Cupriavidus basilensis]